MTGRVRYTLTGRNRPELRAEQRLLVYFMAAVSCITIAACGNQEPESGAAVAEEEAGQERVITLGGSITETVYHLGHEDDLIAVDLTSTYPERAGKLPVVGYLRTLSAENIIALDPTLVLASTDAGPETALEQMESVGIRVVRIPDNPTIEGIATKINAVAHALGEDQKGRELADSITGALTPMSGNAPLPSSPSVLFVYARGSGSLHAAGTATTADLMIHLAGGKNAVNSYEGFRPLTAEGVVEANPDIILVPQTGLESLGGVDGLLKTPGIEQTSAGRNRRIVAMEDLYLLGLGPRVTSAVQELREEFAGTNLQQPKE